MFHHVLQLFLPNPLKPGVKSYTWATNHFIVNKHATYIIYKILFCMDRDNLDEKVQVGSRLNRHSDVTYASSTPF